MRSCNGRPACLVLAASLAAATTPAAIADPATTAALVAPYIGEGPRGDDNGAIAACTGVQPASAAVLCVRAAAPAGGNGTAGAPFASINAAIAAAKAGDVVQVAAGTYAENVALGTFAAPSGKHLALHGGFDATFASRNARTNRSIVDGGDANPAVQLHVDSPGTTTLDGFELMRGAGLGTTFEDGSGFGGGVHAVQHGNGTTVISHNDIHDNRTRNHTIDDTRGGGIHAHTQGFDGAQASVRIEDNHVHDNVAGKGAGINVTGRRAVLLRNRVEDNVTHNDHGGGIYVSTGSTDVEGNVIRRNTVGATVAYGWGGGILIAAASANLSRNLVTDNFTPSSGSGVFWDEGAVGTMKNDLVVRNRCPDSMFSAAAIYVDGGPGGPSSVMLDNVTIADHACPVDAAGAAIVIEDGSMVAVRNAIMRGNTADFATLSGGSYTIAYSITQESGQGNANVDPLFADAVGLDYHVRSTAGRYTPAGFVNDGVSSPAIDTGDPVAAFALETQPNGGRVNQGAYGNTPEASRSAGAPPDLVFASGFE